MKKAEAAGIATMNAELAWDRRGEYAETADAFFSGLDNVEDTLAEKNKEPNRRRRHATYCYAVDVYETAWVSEGGTIPTP